MGEREDADDDVLPFAVHGQRNVASQSRSARPSRQDIECRSPGREGPRDRVVRVLARGRQSCRCRRHRARMSRRSRAPQHPGRGMTIAADAASTLARSWRRARAGLIGRSLPCAMTRAPVTRIARRGPLGQDRLPLRRGHRSLEARCGPPVVDPGGSSSTTTEPVTFTTGAPPRPARQSMTLAGVVCPWSQSGGGPARGTIDRRDSRRGTGRRRSPRPRAAGHD